MSIVQVRRHTHLRKVGHAAAKYVQSIQYSPYQYESRKRYSRVRITQQARIFGQILPIFGPNFGQKLAKFGLTQLIPGLLSYTYPTVTYCGYPSLYPNRVRAGPGPGLLHGYALVRPFLYFDLCLIWPLGGTYQYNLQWIVKQK